MDYPTILWKFILPLGSFFTRREFLKDLEELERSQWFTQDRIEEVQWRNLELLIEHAYLNVPFYQERFRKLGLHPRDFSRFEDIKKLPILRKNEVRDNLEKMIARNMDRKDLILQSTGGSTGEPMRFYNTRSKVDWNRAAVTRGFRWASIEIGEKGVQFVGSVLEAKGARKLAFKMKNLLIRRRYIPALNLSSERMRQMASMLKRSRPTYIWSYTSVLHRFAEFLKEEEINDICPKAIITSSDMLYPHYRELIEKQFKCEAFDNYSSKEFAVASECEHHNYHIYAENVFVEFVRNGKGVKKGMGNVIVTDLRNFGFPLIRYQVGDVGSAKFGTCPCGRGLPMMEGVEGRISDFIITPAGEFISGTNVTAWFRDLIGISVFQVEQLERNYLVFNFVPNDKFTQEEIDLLVERVKRKYLDDEVEIETRLLKEIRPSLSGKRRPVIQRLCSEV